MVRDKTVIRNEANGFLYLRPANLSLGMMSVAMALVLSLQGAVNKSYT